MSKEPKPCRHPLEARHVHLLRGTTVCLLCGAALTVLPGRDAE